MKLKTFYKTEDIIRVGPDEHLSSVLGMLGSSHDAAFVFDEDEFLGVVNPYYSLIQKSYPANTKIKKCLIKPPRLSISDTIGKAAQLMMESKIHYLPVFENDEFVAIISARRVLKNIQDHPKLKISVGDYLKNRKNLITISETSYVSKAMALFKQYKVSKLVVLGPDKKLAGVLTYYDIINHLSTPKERQGYASRQGNKSSLMKKAVKNFYKKNVITIQKDKTLSEVVTRVLDKQIGSVVVVDQYRKPISIITTKDILSAFIEKPVVRTLKINVRGLSKPSLAPIEAFRKRFTSLIKRRKDVQKAEVTIIEKKMGGVFEGVLSIFQKGKKKKIIREEKKDLKTLLNDLKKRGKRLLSK